MVVNTANRGGQKLIKHFSVMTNDPDNPRVDLVVTGKVMGYVTIMPRYVRLMGKADENLSATIQIRPEKAHPFTIKKVDARDGNNISYDLKPLGPNPAQNGYELIVNNTKKDAGAYQDFITIETDLKEKPRLSIPVSGRIWAPPVNAGLKKTK